MGDFVAALEYAKAKVFEWLDGSEVLTKATPSEIALWWVYDLRYVDLPNGGSIIDGPNRKLAALCNAAWSDEGARALFIGMVSSKLIYGYPLTQPEARFAGFLLNGSAPRITRKAGRNVTDNLERNIFIFMLARDIRERFGLTLTRGDAAKKCQSACDAVSLAFIHQNRNEVTFKTVKDLCNNKKLERFTLFVHREAEESNRRLATRSKNALAPECD